MLRVVAHKSAGAALSYYTDGLRKEDYYAEGQEVVGKWFGKGAERLGLSGSVERNQFAALVENRHPTTGESLTPRTRSNRRVGYDINFHAPKSLSVLYALTQDENVLKAFRESVAETMSELEERAQTRVRRGRAESNRVTGNLAWAEFVHFTARPVGGIPDPHLHVHAFTFNATFDEVEDRWKAAQFGAIKQDAPYAEAAFHARLAFNLAKQGYGIERTKRGWEIEGMPSSVLAKFSRRTAQIDRLAKELGVKDAKAKDALGAASREGKRHGLTIPELMAAWSTRLTEEEKVQISKVCYDKGQGKSQRVTAKEAMDHALLKLFERQSVADRSRILAEALRFGVGHLTPSQIKSEFERRGLIGRQVGDSHLCTSVEVLSEEVRLIQAVRAGRNTEPRLGGKRTPALAAFLSDEQKAAVKHILSSRDQVIAIRGGAGVGKTTLMKEAVRAIEKGGRQVFAFAPSAAASRGTLREEGFANADTVAQLLANPKMQRSVRGNVIWIDEAGMLGVRDLWQIMRVAGTSTRVILTGDTAQHAPVARGDGFRLLQDRAGLRVAEVTQIRRQVIDDYRKAIEALSEGDLRTGFRRLDSLGAFIEIDDDAERYHQLAQDFITLGGRKQLFPLVVSPTHAEGAQVTNAIRQARSDAGQLGKEKSFVQYQNVRWEEAELGYPQNYEEGMVVQFHQNAKGFVRGAAFTVTERSQDGTVWVRGLDGVDQVLPLSQAKRFQVFEQRPIQVAKGEILRITRNGQSANGKRLNNGNQYVVKGFDRQGRIRLSNGALLNHDHGHIAYGYCQTSHSAQSKSVRHVLVAQSEDSFLAASKEQFYVSCSRGKEVIRIYTDNRQGLQEAVGNTARRMAGIELAGITQSELSEFMSEDHSGTNFREQVHSHRGADKSKTFVEDLIERGRVEPANRDSGFSWKGYIEMRRRNKSEGGKSRGRTGGGPAKKTKGNGDQVRAWPKTTMRPWSEEEPVAANFYRPVQSEAPSKTAKMETRVEKISKAYQSAANHFKNVAKKSKEKMASIGTRSRSGPKPETEAAKKKTVRMGRTEFDPMKKGSKRETAVHAVREKSASANQKQSKKGKVAEKAKAPPPPPVTKK